jgi:transposase
MYVKRVSQYSGTQTFRGLSFPRRCTRRCSALFEKLRKQINGLEHEIERLQRQLKEAKKKNAELEKENSKLKRDLEAKGLQEDKPAPLSTPSAMQPAYIKPPRSRHRRKPGRKKGHPGARRPAPDKIDQTIEHTLSQCPKCGSTGLGKPCGKHSRIVEDIPPVQPTVTEHVIYEYYCSPCGTKVEAPLTEALPNATLGLRLTLLSAYLHYALGMTTRNICTWLHTFCRFQVTPGGLILNWQRLAELLMPIYEQLAKAAKLSAVLNVDESGWRIGGRTAWIWCFTSKILAYYVLTPSRAGPVVKKVLGSLFNGILVTDFFGAYNRIKAFAKQKCVVHLLREIKQVSLRNNSKEWKSFARRLKRLLHDALKLVITRDKISASTYEVRVANLHIRLAEIFGRSYRDKDCERLAKRLDKHSQELLVFLLHPDVPADNNHAERQMRFAVVMRKNSYGNRSQRGAQTQAILMSIFRTCHLRSIDPITFLASSLAAAIRSGLPLPIPEPPTAGQNG